jgi:hypothetical protein
MAIVVWNHPLLCQHFRPPPDTTPVLILVHAIFPAFPVILRHSSRAKLTEREGVNGDIIFLSPYSTLILGYRHRAVLVIISVCGRESAHAYSLDLRCEGKILDFGLSCLYALALAALIIFNATTPHHSIRSMLLINKA